MRCLVFVLITALIAGSSESAPRKELGEDAFDDLLPQERDSSSVDLQKRISSGREARPGQYKEVCSLQRRLLLAFNHICGAVIYNNITVITAASCVDGISSGSLRVVCGEFNLEENEGTEQTIGIDSKIEFPDFDEVENDRYVNDIALLELDDPLEFNNNVQPAVIDDGSGFLRKKCSVVGWGELGDGSDPDTLQDVSIRIFSNSRCRQRYSSELIPDTSLCFKDLLSADAPCPGDFGGPAICGRKVAGIASWGPDNCGSLTLPSVFTRLSEFNDWIIDNAFSSALSVNGTSFF